MLGNLVNLPPIGRDILPVFPGKKDDPTSPSDPATPPSEGSGETPDTGNGSGQTEPEPGTTSPENPSATPGSSGQIAVGGQHQISRSEIKAETPQDTLRIEAWARRAALEVQKNEQFASMLMKIAKPEAAEQLALLGNDENGSTDFSSVTAAYLENQGDASDANGGAQA